MWQKRTRLLSDWHGPWGLRSLFKKIDILKGLDLDKTGAILFMNNYMSSLLNGRILAKSIELLIYKVMIAKESRFI